MYLYVLEKFKNIHNKEEIYDADTIIEVSEDRYKEIVENMNKKGKKLVRKATKKEIEAYLKMKDNKTVDETDFNYSDDETKKTENPDDDNKEEK